MALGDQSHGDDMKSVRNSDEKLNRLRFPDDLAGTSLFNMAFNDGFFCNTAAQRGARS